MDKTPTHVIQRPRKPREKRILNIYDLDELPQQLKLEGAIVEGFDKVKRRIVHIPDKWLEIYVEIDYLKKPLPVKWDEGCHPYIEVPANKKRDHIVTVMLREQWTEEILELLETATDFCDYCFRPLNPSGADNWLVESSGGGALADLHTCPFCEMESVRWSREFLEWHPIIKKAMECLKSSK